MGRGLGERQRQLLERLRQHDGYWVPLHKLADDADDPNEMAAARSAARGLERRGLVRTITHYPDPGREISTTVIVQEGFRGWEPLYQPETTTRVWVGMHVHLEADALD
jgi:hypothetical protein